MYRQSILSSLIVDSLFLMEVLSFCFDHFQLSCLYDTYLNCLVFVEMLCFGRCILFSLFLLRYQYTLSVYLFISLPFTVNLLDPQQIIYLRRILSFSFNQRVCFCVFGVFHSDILLFLFTLSSSFCFSIFLFFAKIIPINFCNLTPNELQHALSVLGPYNNVVPRLYTSCHY